LASVGKAVQPFAAIWSGGKRALGGLESSFAVVRFRRNARMSEDRTTQDERLFEADGDDQERKCL
jgi:hypothetical protein